MKTCFWILFFIAFYTYLGYGILIWFLVKIKERIGPELDMSRVQKVMDVDQLPDVTVFIAAYNEEDIVDKKIENCNAFDYPKEKLNILWVTDGSDDNTVILLKKYINEHPGTNMRVEHSRERKGKAAAFNRGIQFVKTPIVIFTDANTMVNSEAVMEIVKAFSNPKVGCVAGEKRVSNESHIEKYSAGSEVVKDAAQTEGVYWKYESFLKNQDSRLYSAVGAAGELFAIRTELFEALPSGVLLDDFVLSMKIAQRGYVISYCPTAYAHEGSSANIIEEAKRKVRIAAGGIQSVGMLKPLLNTFKYGTLSFEYISHRVLRWIVTPFALLLLLPLNIVIIAVNGWHPLIYPIILLLQLLFYDLALYGAILSKQGKKSKIPYICYYFMFMNVCVFKGISYLRKKHGAGTWERVKRA